MIGVGLGYIVTCVVEWCAATWGNSNNATIDRTVGWGRVSKAGAAAADVNTIFLPLVRRAAGA